MGRNRGRPPANGTRGADSCQQSLEWTWGQVLPQSSLQMTTASVTPEDRSLLATLKQKTQVSCTQIPDRNRKIINDTISSHQVLVSFVMGR